jgi:hypothetical protein
LRRDPVGIVAAVSRDDCAGIDCRANRCPVAVHDSAQYLTLSKVWIFAKNSKLQIIKVINRQVKIIQHFIVNRNRGF